MEALAEQSANAFWEDNHGRLSEAVYRIKHEAPDHGYRVVAEEEIDALWGEAWRYGLTFEEFAHLCNDAYDQPWETEEGEVFIETDEGSEIYNGNPAIIIGPDQLPPGPASIELLMRASQLVS